MPVEAETGLKVCKEEVLSSLSMLVSLLIVGERLSVPLFIVGERLVVPAPLLIIGRRLLCVVSRRLIVGDRLVAPAPIFIVGERLVAPAPIFIVGARLVVGNRLVASALSSPVVDEIIPLPTAQQSFR